MESVAKAERYVVGIEVVDDDDNDDDAHEDNSCDRINKPPPLPELPAPAGHKPPCFAGLLSLQRGWKERSDA